MSRISRKNGLELDDSLKAPGFWTLLAHALIGVAGFFALIVLGFGLLIWQWNAIGACTGSFP